jgi:DNA-binding response OmpR family regulator
MHVLLATDSGSMRAILRSMLRHFGARQITQANSADEAMATARPKRFDLAVFYLVRAPEANSLDCLSFLRDQGLVAPAIVLETTSDAAQEARAKKLGVSQYLVRPFNLEALYAALAATVEGISNGGKKEGNHGV